MIRLEDRPVVIAVATQIYCARVQSAEARRANGELKNGWAPDMDNCVGEAAALVNKVNLHVAPQERRQAMRQRNHRRNDTIEIHVTGDGK